MLFCMMLSGENLLAPFNTEANSLNQDSNLCETTKNWQLIWHQTQSSQMHLCDKDFKVTLTQFHIAQT